MGGGSEDDPSAPGGESWSRHSRDDAGSDPAVDPRLEAHKAVRAHELMLNEATSRFEHAVLAPLVVLNGGALVAFLTLFGALLGKDSGKRPVIGVAAAAIVVWAVGLVAAAFAVRCASVRQTKISASQRVMREALEDVLYPEAFAMLLAGPVPEGGEPRLSAGHDAKPMRTAAQGVVQIRGRTGRVLPPG